MDRAAEAMRDLEETGQAFVMTGFIGARDPSSGWDWELLLFDGAPVMAGVKFLSRDRKTAHICLANVDQLNRLGQAAATTVGLMRKRELDRGSMSTDGEDHDADA